MKLFLNEGCPHCEGINKDGIKMTITFTDSDDYQGVIPPSIPLLQFADGIQLQGAQIINTIFDEIRNQK